MATNIDELKARVHGGWQEQVCHAFEARDWRPPSHRSSGGPVPWPEVASTAVEAIWSTVEPMVAPVLSLLAEPTSTTKQQMTPAVAEPESLWMSADEVAPLLRTTPHSLRRLARDGNSPVPPHRIGGRWWFARLEVERFLGAGG